ncbi:MAG: polysaccharide deacetylase family protein [Candidatus Rokubacteria bacterium]|nr:polysaccharide deacetylase family protein [Candidatus Rokubacteria bacterium]
MQRDFIGYAGDPPRVEWPGGARLAVSLVVNYEEGAEPSVADGDDESDPGAETPILAGPQVRNTLNESTFEYGSRVGFWRLMDIFDRHDVKVTFFACGRALERNPRAAAEITRRGHEPCSHGYRWVDYFRLSREAQRDDMLRSIDAIERTTGRRPIGFYPRGATAECRELAVEEGGFIYDSITYNEDLPYFVDVQGRRFLTLPYSLDNNDFRYWRSFLEPAQFTRYLTASFDRLYAESERTPKMMSVGLHLRTSGLPARASAVDAFITHARSRPDVWFARREEIARLWWERFGGASQPGG